MQGFSPVRLALPLLMAAIVVAGCAGPRTLPPDAADAGAEDGAPREPSCGPDTTALESRSMSEVTVRPSSGRYEAVQTETLTQGLGCGSLVTLVATTENGGVTIRSGLRYKVDARYRAWGDSPEAARANLVGLSLRHHVTAQESTRRVEVEGLATGWGSRNVELTIEVPASASLDRLEATVANGGVSVSRLSIPALRAEASNGGVSLEMEAPWRSGSWTAHADNGGVSVEVATGDRSGYDVTATAGNGGVTVLLDDAQPVGVQSYKSAHWRTSGFSAREVQTTLEASAGNGGVTVAG